MSRVRYDDPDSSIESEELIIAASAPATTSAANQPGGVLVQEHWEDVTALGEREADALRPGPEQERRDEQQHDEHGPERERPLQHFLGPPDEEPLVHLREHRHAERDADGLREQPLRE